MNALSNTLTQNTIPKHLMQHPCSIPTLVSTLFSVSTIRFSFSFALFFLKISLLVLLLPMLLLLELSLICHLTHRNIVLTSFSSVVRSFSLTKMSMWVCVICVILLRTRIAFDGAEITRLCCVKRKKKTKRVKICEWFSNGIRCLSLDSIYIFPFAMSLPFVAVTLFFIRFRLFLRFSFASLDTFWVS